MRSTRSELWTGGRKRMVLKALAELLPESARRAGPVRLGEGTAWANGLPEVETGEVREMRCPEWIMDFVELLPSRYVPGGWEKRPLLVAEWAGTYAPMCGHVLAVQGTPPKVCIVTLEGGPFEGAVIWLPSKRVRLIASRREGVEGRRWRKIKELLAYLEAIE